MADAFREAAGFELSHAFKFIEFVLCRDYLSFGPVLQVHADSLGGK